MSKKQGGEGGIVRLVKVGERRRGRMGRGEARVCRRAMPLGTRVNLACERRLTSAYGGGRGDRSKTSVEGSFSLSVPTSFSLLGRGGGQQWNGSRLQE